MQRETYYNELASRLQTVAGVKLFSRRLRHVDDVPPSQQPAIFLAQGNQRPSYDPGRTVIWQLDADIYLYVRAPSGQAPGPIINPIMDAVIDLFAPDNPMKNVCTLGGMCQRVEVGSIATDEGTLGEQSVAIIPVTMTVKGSPI